LCTDRYPVGIGLRAHRFDRLVHQLVDVYVLHRPVNVPCLEARELEEIVDQRA